MTFYLIVSETVLYLSFSILVGAMIFQLVPVNFKPKIEIPRAVYFLSILGIIFASIGPVVQVIFYFIEALGFWETLRSVLFDFEVGKAWMFTSWVGLLLYFMILFNKSKYFQTFLVLLLIIAVGYSSHAASLSFWYGLTSHTIHFLGVVVWTGILLIVSLFSKDVRNWSKFLSWFTPTAILCLILIIVSGFMTMKLVVDPKDYVSSWMLPYGQALLVKHILIIPLLVFAFINGILMKKQAEHPGPSTIKWMRAEGIFITLIFIVTGALGIQSPPHDIESMIKTEGYSQLYKWFHPFLTNDIVQLNVDASFLFGAFLSTILLILMVLSFTRKNMVAGSVVFGLFFVFIAYIVLMTAGH
ncbi:copper resistance D family protein [Mesobacillus sp.]|uniref:copper resistance D family protein n=1 Tax=Mesobacillus sp. TaxID=2675271 RepID=UPI0039F10D54